MKHLHVGDWRFYYLEKNGRLSQAQFWYGYLPIVGLILLSNILSPYLPAEILAVVVILTLFPTISNTLR